MQVNLLSKTNIIEFRGNTQYSGMQSKGYSTVKPISFRGATADVVSFSYHAAETKLSKLEHLISSLRLKFNNGSHYELPIHNPKLARFMDESYTSETFNMLLNAADRGGTFGFRVDNNTGFVKTSDIPSEHDFKMADAVWVTDTCRNISLLKQKRPELCTRAIESLSAYYKKQQPEMEKIIVNPNSYNQQWNVGLGHVFHPDTYKPHEEFVRTRLESVGQYLQRASELITSGIVKGAEYGYKNADEVGDNTVESFSTCVKYLKAIDYPHAKSCGAWEEKTFKSSLLSDTAIINEGFRRVLKFMYSNTENPEILKLRTRILNSKHGDVFKDKNSLIELLKSGRQRIIDNHAEEAPGERKLDASLSFVSHYADGRLTFSRHLTDDIKEHVRVLEMLEGNAESHGLVGENGIARYFEDEYKNLNYDMPEKKGLRLENHEAQWFMVSDMSKGYGVQLNRLIKMLSAEKRMPTEDEKALMDKLLAKETEYINRGFARITGEDELKANGKECPEFKLPEAYQAITDNIGNVKYNPGTNTPLAWAQSSLLDASQVFSENLRLLEEQGYMTRDNSKKLVEALIN